MKFKMNLQQFAEEPEAKPEWATKLEEQMEGFKNDLTALKTSGASGSSGSQPQPQPIPAPAQPKVPEGTQPNTDPNNPLAAVSNPLQSSEQPEKKRGFLDWLL
jgi:hypothetical protein